MFSSFEIGPYYAHSIFDGTNNLSLTADAGLYNVLVRRRVCPFLEMRLNHYPYSWWDTV